jgi:hypothetical protein
MLPVVGTIASSLSMGGCIFVLASFLAFSRLRSSFGVISTWFAIAGIGNATSLFIGDPPSGSAACYTQAILFSYARLIPVFASTLLVWTMYKLIFPTDQSMGVVVVHLSLPRLLWVWVVPLVLALLPITTLSYRREADHK